MNKAILFDRDGTLNSIVLGEYITKTKELVLLDGAARAIKKANDAGYLCIIVSNQGGVIYKKGLTYLEVEELNEYLVQLLDNEGAKIDKVYFCPHYPTVEDCDCRKPKAGLIHRALNDFNIEPLNTYMIGDSDSDILAGKKAEVKTIGIGERIEVSADFYAYDVEEAVDYILKRENDA